MKSIVPVPKEQKKEGVLKESNKYRPEVGMWRDFGAGALRVPGFWSALQVKTPKLRGGFAEPGMFSERLSVD